MASRTDIAEARAAIGEVAARAASLARGTVVAVAATTALLTGAPSTATAAPGDTTTPGTGGVTPTPPPRVRLMPLGDSITWGWAPTAPNGYRNDLYDRLTGVGINVDFVGSVKRGSGPDTDNEGHSGWEIDQIAARIDEWIATYRPDIVMLQIGTNDLGRNVDIANAPQRLSTLIDRIRAAHPGCRVVVATITQTPTAALARKIADFNAAIPAIVAARGPLVSMVDQSMVGSLPGDLVDPLHPGTWGYQKMAYQWYRALEPLLNTTGSPWPERDNPFRRTATITAVTPARNATVRAVVPSRVTASHPNGIARVDLYVNGVRVGGDTTAPYTVDVDTHGRSGPQRLVWKVTDRLGNVTSQLRDITADNVAPYVSVTRAPQNRSTVRGTVGVSVAAKDTHGVNRVELIVNGRVVARDTTASYYLPVNTARQPRTMYVQVRAYDHAGNVRYTPTIVWRR
ncbi:GDSL-type esterase/lipase family protein [Micromonospora pattaloongensis]|uniref:GDSL-type esterase/lipase family protein n=1 Tax=Micromonospora pattaloongensis TaxID=405436 RepID=UPI000B812952|nr:GDSL-type esterase/lipase family protein [Micromonospora pattaloongensis]